MVFLLRFLTAGETHGKCLTAIIEGFPSNVEIDIGRINYFLSLRQKGYGRGGRMSIESDSVEILSGIRDNKTLGSPITLKIVNKDWKNWEAIMNPGAALHEKVVENPRPGHADLSGALKYDHKDMRNILERASARETAARVAVGSLARQLLEAFGIGIFAHVVEICGKKAGKLFNDFKGHEEILHVLEKSDLRCLDAEAEKDMIKTIGEAKASGDSIGGVFEVFAGGVPVGLGSHVQWDRKLDARLACSLMSIQAIKGVEVGMGFECARKPGSHVHDEIYHSKEKGYFRKSNNAGGIEGGISNGENIIVRAAMKPIPTLYKPLNTVNITTKEEVRASVERSDICAVPAASIVGEAAVAWEITSAFIEKFGGDSLREIKSNYENYVNFVLNA